MNSFYLPYHNLPIAINAAPRVLRLYIANGTEVSEKAVNDIRHICEEYLPGRYVLEIIDILCEPLRVLSESILMTPTLVRISPRPQQSVSDRIDDSAMIFHVLGISAPVQ